MPDQPTRPVIAITGSSGLIGSALVERLSLRYHVIGFDREGPPHPPPEAECINLDLSSDQDVLESLQAVQNRHGKRLASVIHLAAYYSFAENDSPLYDTITVEGTERLLRALRDFEVEQFIFSSTMLVHAPCKPGERIDENWRIAPKWAYPKSKVRAEQTIDRMRGNMPTAILRISGVYTDRCHSIPIAHQIQRIRERRFTSHFFAGNKYNGQAFLHLDDLVDLIDRMVERRRHLPSKLVAVVGEEDTLSYEYLQTTFARLLHGEDWKTWQLPKWFAKIGAWLQNQLSLGDTFIKPWMIDMADDHYALQISRIKSFTGWWPQHSLRKTLSKMIAALKENPLAWYEENKLSPPSAKPPPPAPTPAEPSDERREESLAVRK